MLAMKRAVDGLFAKYPKQIRPEQCICLIDGNRIPENLSTRGSESVIKVP